MQTKHAVMAVVVAVLCGWGILRSATALFPEALYTYTPRTGPVQRADFEELAEQVEAIQARLGVLMANVPTRYPPCTVLIEDEGLTPRTIETVWRAPQAGQIVGLYCDTTGGTLVPIDIRVDRGTGQPEVVATASCNAAGSTATVGVIPVEAETRVDLHVGTPVGAVTRLSACLTFQPGS